LHPAGPAAERIAELWWAMFWMGTAVFVVTMALFLYSLLRRQERARPPLGHMGFVVLAGIAVPLVILVYILIHSIITQLDIRTPDEGVVVQVIGHQWWWEVRYPGHDVVTANEIWIPVGEPVRLEVRSADVIHSFWVPELHGKIDLMPELTNRFWMQADRPGIFRGQCAEFCGLQHANMAKLVIAVPPDEFEEWMEQQVHAVEIPVEPEVARGFEVFEAAGCGNCHAIRGTPFEPVEVGPDLTHLASRRTLAAGIRPNDTGHLMGWITDPQSIKPGNLMPATHLSPDDLDALVVFLQSLR